MDKPITFSEWLGTQGNMVLLHANCCRIAYEAGQQSKQAKVEELQRRNQMLNDNIKEQGQKLVYQNEVIETQAEKLLGLRNEKSELQKRVDAALKLIESWNEIAFDKTTHWTEGYEEGCYHCAAQLEQALKGDQYDEHRKKAEEAISEK
ncbi:hypothetical protein WKH59_02510 [Acinetobacter baumannii]